MIKATFYDTKEYDKTSFRKATDSIDWQFFEFRCGAETATTASDSVAVCAFVNDKLDRESLTSLKATGVRHVALRCAGFNNVDLAAAKELGIAVTRVPAYSPHAVAEHTVGLLLTLNRKIHRAYNRVREHNFSLNGLIGFDIAGKTVGIVGTGKIGRITAEIFCGFRAKVIAFDPCEDRQWAEKHGINYATLDELIETCDILSLHAPLTPETHHLINRDTIARMRHGVFLINTSRGRLIDTTALLEALRHGQFSGVALDVYEEEEGIFFEDHSESLELDEELTTLLTFPNVLITSHQAFLTHEALTQIAQVTSENIRRSAAKLPFLPGTCLTGEPEENDAATID